jgi:hypothetical protein
MEQQQNIDDLFKSELGGYAETPPPMAWDALEKRLDKLPPRGSGFTGRRAIYVALISTVLLLSVSVAKKIAENNTRYDAGNIAGVNNNKENAIKKNTIPANNGGNNVPLIANNIAAANSDEQPQNKNTANKNNITPNKLKQAGNGKTYKANNYASAAPSNKKNPNGDEEEDITGEKKTQVYNSSGAPLKADELSGKETKDEENKEPNKKLVINDKENHTNFPPPPHNVKPKFKRFELGIKAGYERGFDNAAAKKIVVSPYLQYNLSPKMGIMLQPAIKNATITTRAIGNAQSYYKAGDTSTNSSLDPNIVHSPDGTFNMFLWHYNYSQTHDSIVKSHSISGNYIELELPVLLKRELGYGFSVYGGINFAYSKLINVNEQTYTTTIVHQDSSNIQLGPEGNYTAPQAQFSVAQLFPYHGTNISNYKDPYATPAASMWRAGYMLGFSYAYKNRWLVDGLVQQTPTPANLKGGYNINTPLSTAYFRFTLGYKLK